MAQAYELSRHARWGRGVIALAALVTIAVPGTSPAAAAAPPCTDRDGENGVLSPGPAAAVTVDIDTPVSGERVRGTVQVSGTARSVEPLSRIDLLRGGSVLAFHDVAPSPTVVFSLSWDTAEGPVGRTPLEVRACGPAAFGRSSVEVVVPARRPLWVGLVVGLAGVGGLALASAFRPRSRPARRRSGVAGHVKPPAPTALSDRTSRP